MNQHIKKCRQILSGGLVVLLGTSSTAFAANTDIKFAGFASVAYAKEITSNEGPLNGIKDEGEYRDFNTLGLRMDADLHERVSFAAQLVADGNDNYKPDFDWIYASVTLTPELKLDIGKTRVPLYMYSDFIDVGYAYQWISPPSTVYGRNILNTLEGLKLAYTTNIGNWGSELLIFGGAGQDHINSDDGKDNIDLAEDNTAGVAWTVDYEWLTLRAVYMQSNLTIHGYTGIDQLIEKVKILGESINDVLPNVVQVVPRVNTAGIRDALALDHDAIKYYAIGSTVDFGQFFGVFELKDSEFDENIATSDSVGGYLTFGARLPGKVTVSGTFGQSTQKANQHMYMEYTALMDKYTALTTSSPDPIIQAAVATAVGTIEPIGETIKAVTNVAQDLTVNEYSLQVRWDFHRSAALKFEYVIQDNDQYFMTSATTAMPEKVKPQAYLIGLDLTF